MHGLRRSHSASLSLERRFGLQEPPPAGDSRPAPLAAPQERRPWATWLAGEDCGGCPALSARSRQLSEPALVRELTTLPVGGRGSGIALGEGAFAAADMVTQTLVEPSPTARNASARVLADAAAAAEVRPGAVRVVARFRPPLSAEERNEGTVFVTDAEAGTVLSTSLDCLFQFDGVFDQEATQEAVYDHIGRSTVGDVLEGYNGTILAYGATGSGKTYCMFGPPEASEELRGMVPRATRQVFAGLADARNNEGSIGAVVECSFLEVYCEQLRDLLQRGNNFLQVKETPKHGVYVDGLARRVVGTVGEAMQALKAGVRLRAAANNSLNQHSSRSHAIFTLRVVQESTTGTRDSKLTLVDLAGSEKLQKSGGATGAMLEEAKKINSSLSALGSVIGALADRRPHVPYRDSRLTRVLEDSLGGNCGTTLLVALSPSARQAAETISSLRFATRARKVRTHMRVNTTATAATPAVGCSPPDAALMQRIAQLEQELARAHRDLEESRSGSKAQEQQQQGANSSEETEAAAREMMGLRQTEEEANSTAQALIAQSLERALTASPSSSALATETGQTRPSGRPRASSAGPRGLGVDVGSVATRSRGSWDLGTIKREVGRGRAGSSSGSAAVSQSTASLGLASCVTSLTTSSTWRIEDDEIVPWRTWAADAALTEDRAARYEEELAHVRSRREALLRELDFRRRESQDLQRQLGESQAVAAHHRVAAALSPRCAVSPSRRRLSMQEASTATAVPMQYPPCHSGALQRTSSGQLRTGVISTLRLRSTSPPQSVQIRNTLVTAPWPSASTCSMCSSPSVSSPVAMTTAAAGPCSNASGFAGQVARGTAAPLAAAGAPLTPRGMSRIPSSLLGATRLGGHAAPPQPLTPTSQSQTQPALFSSTSPKGAAFAAGSARTAPLQPLLPSAGFSVSTAAARMQSPFLTPAASSTGVAATPQPASADAVPVAVWPGKTSASAQLAQGVSVETETEPCSPKSAGTDASSVSEGVASPDNEPRQIWAGSVF
eukprot:TRINITY_DN17112_c1_g2_i1.p1 TRINITY_DN17112_c1_g2~~TRINITY_DN17112_c1_g2_i1.p1  ORF type:complete len:1013 (+),score=187.68 TRINITY_DN17112_c1_g2_i1:203-3241(+)